MYHAISHLHSSSLFRHKIIQIQLKDVLFCKINPYGLHIFLITLVIPHTYSKKSRIFNLPDKINLENCLCIKKCFNKFLPTIFKNSFTISEDSNEYDSCWPCPGCFVLPSH